MLSRVWLCNPVDCSPPGSSVHEILQEKRLVWVATPVFFLSPYIRVHCYMTSQFIPLKRQSLYPYSFIWGSDIGFCQWNVNRHDVTTDFKKSCMIELASITRSKMIDKWSRDNLLELIPVRICWPPDNLQMCKWAQVRRITLPSWAQCESIYPHPWDKYNLIIVCCRDCYTALL